VVAGHFIELAVFLAEAEPPAFFLRKITSTVSVPFESDDLEVVHKWALQQVSENRYQGIGLVHLLHNAARRSFVLMLAIENPELAPNICVPVAK